MLTTTDILVIDDDDDMRRCIVELFEEFGYSVAAGRDGREALGMAKQHRPCLIVTDLMMPGLNGWDFLDAIAHDDELASVPIAVITASGDVMPPTRARLVAMLRKPLSSDRLISLAETHCRSRAAG